ncbi:hypothetical protein Pint_02113 [Pistacia integerrima]|uniref:Uncharacterized protein n=1 Tax=Pistacia integerrima TaxID=434235 RepID=A0ACC0ZLW2_9ROSI|nr:hypothetical protein Pint_02113 [Pistacia integerrima]
MIHIYCLPSILLGCKMKMDPFPGTWGKVDTRFDSHVLPYVVSQILHRLEKINVDKVVNYIVSCKNLDGGFGCTHGGESYNRVQSADLELLRLLFLEYPELKAIDPACALPVDVINRIFFGK